MSPYHYIDLTLLSQGTSTCSPVHCFSPPVPPPLFTFPLPVMPYHPLLHSCGLSLHLHPASCLLFRNSYLLSFLILSYVFPYFHARFANNFPFLLPLLLSVRIHSAHLFSSLSSLPPPSLCSFSNASTIFSCPLRLAKQSPTLSPSCFYQG